jgi:hypothetical protein
MALARLSDEKHYHVSVFTQLDDEQQQTVEFLKPMHDPFVNQQMVTYIKLDWPKRLRCLFGGTLRFRTEVQIGANPMVVNAVMRLSRDIFTGEIRLPEGESGEALQA